MKTLPEAALRPALPEATHADDRLWTLLRGLPLALLIGGLLVSGVLAGILQAAEERAEHTLFDKRASELANGLETRLSASADVLRGVVGLFASQSGVSRSAFQAYVSALDLGANYPGTQGVGFAQWIPPADLSRHEERLRGEGFADYSVRPGGPRDAYSAIVLLEPFDWRNRRAFGFDMYSEPVRRAAMQRAAESGLPALSGRVTLVQETERDVQPGFLIYLPIYRLGMAPQTLAERREQLVGWAYSPLRARDLIEAFLRQEFPTLAGDVALRVHAGAAAVDEQLLYDSHAGQERPLSDVPALVRTLSVLGTPLRVEVTALNSYRDGQTQHLEGLLVGVGGLVITLLAVVGLTLLRRNQRRLEGALWSAVSANEQLARSEQRIRDMALHDPLTGLPNRRYLLDRAQHDLALARRHQRALAVAFIDLDRFKPINDEHGHDVGDEVLKTVSARLTALLRRSDTVCRQGGDEFVALLTDTGSREELQALALRVAAAIERPCEVKGLSLCVSASIGLSVFPGHGEDIDSLIHAADQAMYRAKHLGRRDPAARVQFAPEAEARPA